MENAIIVILAAFAGLIYGSIVGSRNVGYEKGGVMGVVISVASALACIATGHYYFDAVALSKLKDTVLGIYIISIAGWFVWIKMRNR